MYHIGIFKPLYPPDTGAINQMVTKEELTEAINSLNVREAKVLYLRCLGLSITQIADVMHYSDENINKIMAGIYTVFELENTSKSGVRLEALRYAVCPFYSTFLGGYTVTLDDPIWDNWPNIDIPRAITPLVAEMVKIDDKERSQSGMVPKIPAWITTGETGKSSRSRRGRNIWLYVSLVVAVVSVVLIIYLLTKPPQPPLTIIETVLVTQPPVEIIQTELVVVVPIVATTTATETVEPTQTITALPTSTNTPAPSFTPQIINIGSTFDKNGTDGWRFNSGEMTNPGVGGNTGGENDGHLRAAPRYGGVSYYIAPPKFFRNWREFTELRFDMWSQGGEYFTEERGFIGDIYLANGDLEAWLLLPYRPPETWETFVIPLIDDGNWVFGAGTMRLEDVLSNVTDFRIRAEYGRDTDFSGLDNVFLVK